MSSGQSIWTIASYGKNTTIVIVELFVQLRFTLCPGKPAGIWARDAGLSPALGRGC